MKITQILTKKTYCILAFDNGKSFVVSADYPESRNLEILSDIDLNRCLKDNEAFHNQYAMDCALNYLSYCERTEEQIRVHLKRKQLPEEIVSGVMEKLKDYRYADDERYAKLYVQSAVDSVKGKQYIASKLRQKGISKEIVSHAVQQINEEDEYLLAREWIEKHYQSMSQYPPSVRKEKLLRQMISRGYRYAMLTEILDTFEDDDSEYQIYYEKLIDKKLNSLMSKGLSELQIKQKLLNFFIPKGVAPELIYERIQKILH